MVAYSFPIAILSYIQTLRMCPIFDNGRSFFSDPLLLISAGIESSSLLSTYLAL